MGAAGMTIGPVQLLVLGFKDPDERGPGPGPGGPGHLAWRCGVPVNPRWLDAGTRNHFALDLGLDREARPPPWLPSAVTPILDGTTPE